MTVLHDLAEAAGLTRVWQDAKGQQQIVADKSLATILRALGYPAETEAAARASLETLSKQQRQAPGFLSADVGAPIALPAALPDAQSAELELELEAGPVRSLAVVRGVLDPIDEPGYHRLRIGGHELVLAVAPSRCVLPSDLPGVEQARLWGPAIQIPSLHDKPGHFGDFGDLRQAVRLFAERGAHAVAISPVHAPLASERESFAPYSPSSRLFLNSALAEVANAGTGDGGSLINWASGLPERHAALRRAFAQLGPEQRAQVQGWAQEQGAGLQQQALFDALSLHLGEADWRAWPAGFQQPASPDVTRFAAEHADEIAFHVFAQWMADRSLRAVQDEAKSAGMAIGLIADLAVGISPNGSDAWALQDSMLRGLTIGAPPDPLGPEGQNWGLTSFLPGGLRQSGFAPWIATLRAALRHAGGVRIDHAFGLARLWVVPEGGAATEGAYLAYPFDDMLRVIAIESHRGGAVIVGEDLGTRPPGFVEPITERGILGMRVLWFERDAEGFSPAPGFAEQAVAMTATHDTATVAGWWTGRDIEWNRRLARGEGWQEEEKQRMADREALWSAIGKGAPQPAIDDPAPVVDAAVRHLAGTPSALTIIPLEDLLALEEQPNLPGTIDEHPNWRRRLAGPLAELLAEPATARRIASLMEARSA